MAKFFKDVKKYWQYMLYAAKSELRAEVANSYLNWVWWILEPLMFMLIYAVVFQYFFKGKIEHLTAFIFVGITMWEFFSKMMKTSVRLVKRNKSIVSKVYVPKYILVLQKLFVNLFKTFISFSIVIVLMIVLRITPNWYMLWTIPILLSFFIFVFGICTIICHFGVYIDDLANITDIGLRLVFYATGVFYNLDSKVTRQLGYVLVHVNPMAMYITSVRNVLLYGSEPHTSWLIAWTVAGLLLCVIGIYLIQKNENNYVKLI